MFVKLLTGLAGRHSTKGHDINHLPGEVVEMTAEEGKRFIDANLAVKAAAPAKEKTIEVAVIGSGKLDSAMVARALKTMKKNAKPTGDADSSTPVLPVV